MQEKTILEEKDLGKCSESTRNEKKRELVSAGLDYCTSSAESSADVW